MKNSSKVAEIKNISDEEFEMEMVELKVHLSVLKELLQECEED